MHRLPGLKPSKLSAGLQGNNSYSYMPLNTSVSCMPQPSTCSCRLPGLKPSKLSAGLQGNNSYSYMPLNTSVSYMPQPSTCSCPPSNPPNASNPPAGLQGNNSYSYMASKATTLTATCRCHLFFRRFKTAVCPPSSNPPNASNPPAGLQGNNSYSYMPLPSVFQGVQDCRLPALKPPKTPETLPQASKATTLTATCP